MATSCYLFYLIKTCDGNQQYLETKIQSCPYNIRNLEYFKFERIIMTVYTESKLLQIL